MNQWSVSRRAFLAGSVGAMLSGSIAAQQQQPPVQQRAAAAQIGNPEPFTSKDGKIKGWKLTIPGSRPLATPCVVKGKVFVGGGFGSHEFYALDAVTGKKVWQYQTSDDGPTAAVVEDGLVALTPRAASWKSWRWTERRCGKSGSATRS